MKLSYYTIIYLKMAQIFYNKIRSEQLDNQQKNISTVMYVQITISFTYSANITKQEPNQNGNRNKAVHNTTTTKESP